MVYDVAISFAGEDRRHADELARALQQCGIKTFYDNYEKDELWGKDLYTHLTDIYHNQAKYCIMFLSTHYAKKLWTNQERKAAQARAFTENREYILPIRLDQTEIPGVLPTTGFLSWPPENAQSTAILISKKLANYSSSQVNLRQQTFAPSMVQVKHRNSLNYKATDISFLLKDKHVITREISAGIMASKFTLYVDGKPIHERELKTFQSAGFEFTFEIEGVPCSAKYNWAVGVYLGSITVAGQRLL